MSEAVTSPQPAQPTSVSSVQAPAQPLAQSPADIRHNYWVTIVEGGLFIGGVAFINPSTILPDMVHELGGSSLLISLMPVMMSIGFLMPQILTAHWIDTLPRFKPLTVAFGAFQRLPYLLAAIALFFAGSSKTLALAAVALAPLLSGIMGGITNTAWQQLYARCIPESRRSSVAAYRYIISCTLGLIASFVIAWLLHSMSKVNAYATLHLITFLFIAGSYAFFVTTREPKTPLPTRHSLTLLENLRLMPSLVMGDRTFRNYLFSRVLRTGQGITTPFLAIYARERLNQPEAYLGYLLFAQMTGSILGNLLAARLGDRTGGKLPHQLGIGMFIVLTAWSMFASTSAGFLGIFFLFGFASNLAEVGNFTLMLEIVPQRNRSTCLALAGLINLPAILGFAWLSAALWKHTHTIHWLAVSTILTLTGAMALLAPIRDPRSKLACPAPDSPST